MNLAITRIKQIIPHFNEEALTENDFWKICENEEIRVVETHLFVNGFYFSDGRRNFIYLNSGLRGIFWLENAFHEIAHHFLHTPLTNPRQEEEARAIALIANRFRREDSANHRNENPLQIRKSRPLSRNHPDHRKYSARPRKIPLQ